MLKRVIFYIGYIPTMIFFASFTFTLGLLLPFRWRLSIGTLWNWFIVYHWLPLFVGSKPEIQGLENLPHTPFVAVSNHQSEWETLALCRILRPASVVMKKSLLSIPIFGWGLRMTRPIPIDRGNPKAAIRDILKFGKLRLQQGNHVLIFPEGTRVQAGTIGSYKRTAFKLAIESQVPIVPILHNAGSIWPTKGGFQKGIIKVVIGVPLSTESKTDIELANEVETWARETLITISSV